VADVIIFFMMQTVLEAVPGNEEDNPSHIIAFLMVPGKIVDTLS
jgi:hypothetical protein